MTQESNVQRAINLMNEASDEAQADWTASELALMASIILYLEDECGIEFDGIDGLIWGVENWLNE